MFNILKRLINKKFYKTYEEIQDRIDIFYIMGRIDSDEYKELTILVNEKYTT